MRYLPPRRPRAYPVLLQRTPYDKTMPLSLHMLDPLKAAKRGYAVVIQDTRGRYARPRASSTPSRTTSTMATTPSSGSPPSPGRSEGGDVWQLLRRRHPVASGQGVPATSRRHRSQESGLQLLRRVDLSGWSLRVGLQRVLDAGQSDPGKLQSLAARKQIPHERRGQLVQAVDALEAVFHALPLQAFPHCRTAWRTIFMTGSPSRRRCVLAPPLHRGGALPA